MDVKKLNGIEDIVADAYDDPNSSGRPMQYLYDSIIDHNPQLSKDETMKLFLEFVEHLLRKDMVQLYGAYDKKNDREVRWNGSVEDIMDLLKKFTKDFPQEKLESEPVYFFDFEYCFLVWKVDWPIDLRKYGLEN